MSPCHCLHLVPNPVLTQLTISFTCSGIKVAPAPPKDCKNVCCFTMVPFYVLHLRFCQLYTCCLLHPCTHPALVSGRVQFFQQISSQSSGSIRIAGDQKYLTEFPGETEDLSLPTHPLSPFLPPSLLDDS